jgi:hypothetical protein
MVCEDFFLFQMLATAATAATVAASAIYKLP